MVGIQRTLAGFLLPALPWGKGAGAAFFPLGGIFKMCRGCHREQKPLANVHPLLGTESRKREKALLPFYTLAICIFDMIQRMHAIDMLPSNHAVGMRLPCVFGGGRRSWD